MAPCGETAWRNRTTTLKKRLERGKGNCLKEQSSAAGWCERQRLVWNQKVVRSIKACQIKSLPQEVSEQLIFKSFHGLSGTISQ